MIINTLIAPTQETFAVCMRSARLSHRSTGDGGGPKDIELAKKLIKAGDEHAKAIRGMIVYAEITATRYWWQEMDTYRIGTEPLGSESTMHDRPDLTGAALEGCKSGMPEGTLQKRIWLFSYQTLARIYRQRKSHRLAEWRELCKWVETLPYSDLMVPVKTLPNEREGI